MFGAIGQPDPDARLRAVRNRRVGRELKRAVFVGQDLAIKERLALTSLADADDLCICHRAMMDGVHNPRKRVARGRCFGQGCAGARFTFLSG